MDFCEYGYFGHEYEFWDSWWITNHNVTIKETVIREFGFQEYEIGNCQLNFYEKKRNTIAMLYDAEWSIIN